MADTGGRRSGRQNAGKLPDLIAQIDTLVERYRQRERANPEDEIAGSSRFLLISLLESAREWLRDGAVATAVNERLADSASGQPDVHLKVSDELDLLRAVSEDLHRRQMRKKPERPSAGGPVHAPPSADRWASGPSKQEPRRYHAETKTWSSSLEEGIRLALHSFG
jgi:hypothetical protein